MIQSCLMELYVKTWIHFIRASSWKVNLKSYVSRFTLGLEHNVLQNGENSSVE